MEPAIKPLDKILFYKYLDKATHYMEFGSGGSTYQASIRPNIKSICTVESDLEWIQKLQTKITHPSIQYNYIDIQASPRNLGYPGNDCKPEDMKKYSDVKIPSETDLVLIDGRFRVVCCLKLIGQINENCIVVFDDFLDRPQYHGILDYYNIIDKTENNSLVILKKKGNITIANELIAKYEIISQ
jgi:protein O-GlcNAc transferase